MRMTLNKETRQNQIFTSKKFLESKFLSKAAALSAAAKKSFAYLNDAAIFASLKWSL